MNEIRVIDLLNKIANGEEVPKYILYYNMLKDKTDTMMVCKENIIYKLDQLEIQLNSRVEILEEEPRDINVCGSWFTKSEYDELEHSEEEKKIPEKLDYFTSEEQLYNMSKLILFNNIVKKINEIIEFLDYLKSKGDE